MKTNRRQLIKAGVLGSVAAATMGAPLGRKAAAQDFDRTDGAAAPLEILILGGTGFIGPHMVREALRRGHRVTLFNRGRTNNTLFPDLETTRRGCYRTTSAITSLFPRSRSTPTSIAASTRTLRSGRSTTRASRK